MTDYEDKQNRRRERFEAKAEAAHQEAGALYGQAKKKASVIPFGQPILVGHHSEGRDRRFRGSITRDFERSFEAEERAKHYADKAEGVGKGGISSDDPDAIAKLETKIEQAEAAQEKMKAANRLIKKQDRDGLAALGFTPQNIENLFTPDFAGRIGFPAYSLTNNNANIRRMKQRVAALEKQVEAETTETEFSGFRVIENTEENRLQFIFPGKPSSEIRRILKSNGFRWAPSLGAWQRQLNNSARYSAQCAVKKIEAAQQADDNIL